MEGYDIDSNPDEIEGGFSSLVGDLFDQETQDGKEIYEDEQRRFSEELHGIDKGKLSSSNRTVKYKPKGMYLGHRRDNDEAIDIDSNVLARHAAMLGSTGSGKTVALNAILLSLIYKKSPAELNLVLIDPKMVEFSLYKGIPQYFPNYFWAIFCTHRDR